MSEVRYAILIPKREIWDKYIGRVGDPTPLRLPRQPINFLEHGNEPGETPGELSPSTMLYFHGGPAHGWLRIVRGDLPIRTRLEVQMTDDLRIFSPDAKVKMPDPSFSYQIVAFDRRGVGLAIELFAGASINPTELSEWLARRY